MLVGLFPCFASPTIVNPAHIRTIRHTWEQSGTHENNPVHMRSCRRGWRVVGAVGVTVAASLMLLGGPSLETRCMEGGMVISRAGNRDAEWLVVICGDQNDMRWLGWHVVTCRGQLLYGAPPLSLEELYGPWAPLISDVVLRVTFGG